MSVSKVKSDNRIGAGQRVSLIPTIKRLIRSYPGGLGLVKELVQNADDAGARTVQITLDWRTHSVENLPESGMGDFLGPALLIFNDAVFEEQDFQAIEEIGMGSKQTAPTKAGRFGLGFNSVYHITDYPSFASADRIKFFDPHASVFESGGEGWYLDDPEINDFIGLYKSGLPNDSLIEHSTVFRLPLRVQIQQVENPISRTTFEEDAQIELRKELLKISEDFLIFLKSVDEIRICEILSDEDAATHELLFVSTKNKETVSQKRQKLITAVQKGASANWIKWKHQGKPCLLVSYLHEIEIAMPTYSRTSTWRICNFVRLDQEGEMLAAIESMAECDEKAVPWAGAAARIKAAGTGTGWQLEDMAGQAYCFLPLNFETGLPVHVHGFFDLDEARTDLTRVISSSDENKKIRANWNLLLVEEVLAYAYAHLLKKLIQDVGDKDPEQFYSFFPVSSGNPTMAELPKRVIHLLRKQRVIKSSIEHIIDDPTNPKETTTKTFWVTPSTIKILPSDWEKLTQPLLLENIDLPEHNLPKNLLDAFDNANLPLSTFTSSDLRKQLQTTEEVGTCIDDVPRECLKQKEWIVALLKYCLHDGHKNVIGLPLAILADGTVQTFGYNPPGFIYTAGAPERQLFELYPQWFLDEDLMGQVPDIVDCVGVNRMVSSDVAKRLKDIIDPKGKQIIEWYPQEQNLPNSKWLAQIYIYFADRELPDELKEVPLVPSDEDRLHIGHTLDTPLWCDASALSDTWKALSYFKVPTVKARSSLKKAISRFLSSHPEEFIFRLTVPDLIDTLSTIEEFPPYHKEFYGALLNFLSDRHWIEGKGSKDIERHEILSSLPIYLTTKSNVLSSIQDAYIAVSEPPKVAGSLKLLELGPNNEWKRLFKLLQAKELNHFELTKLLIDRYGELTAGEQVNALSWIRDHLSLAQTDVEKENVGTTSKPTFIKKLVREAHLIRDGNSQLRAARSLYHPSSQRLVEQVLGHDAAYLPNMEFYRENANRWLDFFTELRMRSSPSPNDLVVHVDHLIEEAKSGLTKDIKKALIDVYRHLEKNWARLGSAELSREKKTLADALKERAWLPAERSENQLGDIPGCVFPSDRLYKASELEFFAHRNLVASQRPLFSTGKMPSASFYEPLGFGGIPASTTVVEHFKVLIDLWDNHKDIVVDSESFQLSIHRIYNYLATYFVSAKVSDDKRTWLHDQLVGYECLWDGQRFWLPEQSFQHEVSCFGSYRVKICPPSPIRDVYEILGQKQCPELDDYRDFILEIDGESRGCSLNEEQANYVSNVLEKIDWVVFDENVSVKDLNLLLLTDDGLLLPPDQILVNDAPARFKSIGSDRTDVKILHDRVPDRLAIAAGCRSLQRDVEQRPVAKVVSEDVKANRLCQEWQEIVRSPEFKDGLERLVFDEQGIVEVDLSWLDYGKVTPAGNILTDLVFDGKQIAANVHCYQYYEPSEQSFYVVVDDDMVYCLAESINFALSRADHPSKPLNDISKLILILNISHPKKIEGLLTKRDIKLLSKSKRADRIEIELEEDDLFGSLANDSEHWTDGKDYQYADEIKEYPLEESSDSTVNDISGDANQSMDKPQAEPSHNNLISPGDSKLKDHKEKVIQPTNKQSILDVHDFGFNSNAPLEQDARKQKYNAEDSNVSENNEASKRGHIDVSGPLDGNNDERGLSSGRNDSRDQGPGTSQTYRYGVRVRSGLTDDQKLGFGDHAPEEIRQRIDYLGTQQVLEYERKNGRLPKDMNEVRKNHPGYDIKSEDELGNVRYIEVKSLKGEWGRRGVKVTLKQFQEGEKYADKFWLYVVERAEDAPNVITIQDPVRLVGEFYYDDSWRQLAELSDDALAEELTLT